MPFTLEPEQRETIERLAREGQSVREIAKQARTSAATVSRYMHSQSLVAVRRSQTENATQAKQADIKAMRAELARGLLDDVRKLREQLWAPTTVYAFGGKDNTFNEHQIPEPDFNAKRNILTAIGIAIDKSLALDRHDQEVEGLAAVDAWLRSLGLGVTPTA